MLTKGTTGTLRTSGIMGILGFTGAELWQEFGLLAFISAVYTIPEKKAHQQMREKRVIVLVTPSLRPLRSEPEWTFTLRSSGV
ncbi:unnamed protein product [Didymodactylos carnosus]|uniref:Uncharacterized protein n=1 Tax=Didymodactylos carnosus TaxID=1234261 RepID=A0A815TJZ4_9BILA|nr:unnamed protein product [Didymodactylos carnosus]CAF1517150.1 unnamed protein product [Didymodactylos carnosus]CAF4304495.1 unnamed protein product [Didymodactylos carnosus]CAF4368541.1 unnamed protein product [Didymodactylos carnosus]